MTNLDNDWPVTQDHGQQQPEKTKPGAAVLPGSYDSAVWNQSRALWMRRCSGGRDSATQPPGASRFAVKHG